jgi:hypothetical protein
MLLFSLHHVTGGDYAGMYEFENDDVVDDVRAPVPRMHDTLIGGPRSRIGSAARRIAQQVRIHNIYYYILVVQFSRHTIVLE